MSEQFLLKNLVDILSPRGLNKLSSTTETKSIEVKIRELIIEKTTKFLDSNDKADSIKSTIEDDFGNRAEPAEANAELGDFEKGFHILSMKHGCISKGSYKDDNYWKQGADTNVNASSNALWKAIYAGAHTAEDPGCDVVVIVVRDPYMTPADAKTEDIEIFLNYMPPIIVNQMVPYLDVELAINRSARLAQGQGQDEAQTWANEQKDTLNSPSLLRFLLGSVTKGKDGAVLNGFTDSDRSLIRTANGQFEALQFAETGRDKATADLAAFKVAGVTKRGLKATDKEQERFDDELKLKEAQLQKLSDKAAAAAAKRSGGSVSFNTLSGMELFMSPQSLTNMSTLKSGNNRLMQVKPFLPFASIINFDVSILNAGAGAMATKTAKLQIKVHDKSRIAEFSEFIKGPAGYATAKIWTSFGWLCPRSISEEDEYAKLVNDKMFSEDCWTVKNTQFTIAPGGDVTLNLDLVSFGVSNTNRASIQLQDNSYHSYVVEFQRIMEEIEELSRPIKDSPLGPDARIVQILNAGAQGNMLPADIKDPTSLVSSVITQYINTGKLDKTAGETLIKNLATVLDPYAGRAQLADVRAKSISGLLSTAALGSDPFIPQRVEKTAPNAPAAAGAKPPNPKPTVTESPAAQPDSNYFSESLMKEISFFYNPPPPPVLTADELRAQKSAGKKAKPAVVDDGKVLATPPRPLIGTTSKVISFGKLFTKLAVPAILNANKDVKVDPNAEIQIIFYALNDECGPVSGQSIAEFPIDLQRLSYALDDTMSIKNKYDFTVQEFLKIVINNQFNDDRSIGYGMLSKGLFMPFDKEKPGIAAAEKNSAYETGMAAWQAENSGFRKPMIEMFMETSGVGVNTASRINKVLDANRPAAALPPSPVIRVHIYDKQNNPRKLFTQIIEMSEGFQMGTINGAAVKSALKKSAGIAKDAAAAKATADLKNPSAKRTTGAVIAPDKAGNTAAKTDIETKEAAIASALKSITDYNTKNTNATPAERDANQRATLAKLESDLGMPTGTILKTPKGDFITRIDKTLFGTNGIRAQLSKFAPTLDIGANGTLIKTVQLTSKTDDLMAAANLINIMKTKPAGAGGSTSAPASGLEGPGGLPIRTVPAELTMNIVGCPALKLYQQFFIDLGTGTSFDNLYQVKQITHKITQGKFESSLTFMYTNGYGKFTTPPSIQLFLADASKAAQKLRESYTPPGEQPKPAVPAKPTVPPEKAQTEQARAEALGKSNYVPDPSDAKTVVGTVK